ncbi:hypothetical protein LMG26411_01806 [Cupriavidus numazuensis]|uniref:Uncharacterized protein n=1 Tax=Cupriavidus numazuensis TaxID=221992 RepID=A0ABM8TEH3_9BURK|nr:hypothetical protein LMG26411_01806 [Cupriavidus numazuensis]
MHCLARQHLQFGQQLQRLLADSFDRSFVRLKPVHFSGLRSHFGGVAVGHLDGRIRLDNDGLNHGDGVISRRFGEHLSCRRGGHIGHCRFDSRGNRRSGSRDRCRCLRRRGGRRCFRQGRDGRADDRLRLAERRADHRGASGCWRGRTGCSGRGRGRRCSGRGGSLQAHRTARRRILLGAWCRGFWRGLRGRSHGRLHRAGRIGMMQPDLAGLGRRLARAGRRLPGRLAARRNGVETAVARRWCVPAAGCGTVGRGRFPAFGFTHRLGRHDFGGLVFGARRAARLAQQEQAAPCLAEHHRCSQREHAQHHEQGAGPAEQVTNHAAERAAGRTARRPAFAAGQRFQRCARAEHDQRAEPDAQRARAGQAPFARQQAAEEPPHQRHQPQSRKSEPAKTHDRHATFKTTGSDCSG